MLGRMNVGALGKIFKTRNRKTEELDRIGNESTLPKDLIASLNDTDPQVRASAIEKLGNIGDNSAVDTLGSMLKDSRGQSGLIVETLRKVGNSKAVDTLIYGLENPDSWVRNKVAEALYKINDPRAKAPLERYAHNNEMASEKAAHKKEKLDGFQKETLKATHNMQLQAEEKPSIPVDEWQNGLKDILIKMRTKEASGIIGHKEADSFRESVDRLRNQLLLHEAALSDQFHQVKFSKLSQIDVYVCDQYWQYGGCPHGYCLSNLPKISVYEAHLGDTRYASATRFCPSHSSKTGPMITTIPNNNLYAKKLTIGDVAWLEDYGNARLERNTAKYENNEPLVFVW